MFVCLSENHIFAHMQILWKHSTSKRFRNVLIVQKFAHHMTFNLLSAAFVKIA